MARYCTSERFAHEHALPSYLLYGAEVPELTVTGLQVVLEVGRSGSFSAAAEALGYPPSALSRVALVSPACPRRG
jgi:hypothetical protein